MVRAARIACARLERNITRISDATFTTKTPRTGVVRRWTSTMFGTTHVD
jgi:hypothetical protein